MRQLTGSLWAGSRFTKVTPDDSSTSYTAGHTKNKWKLLFVNISFYDLTDQHTASNSQWIIMTSMVQIGFHQCKYLNVNNLKSNTIVSQIY